LLVIDYKEKPATISKEDMIIPIIQERQCGECTACCEGYVTGSAHGRIGTQQFMEMEMPLAG
jgi:hypothetical protein